MIFNQILKDESLALNHEGALSHKLTPEMELYTAVCSLALQPKFYETPQNRVERLAELVRRCDALFVAKLAVYARREMYIRSVPLLLVVELARVHNGDNLVSSTVEQIVMRADEIMELLMCYQWRNPQPGYKKLAKLSHQIRMGLQASFNKFDEYQFAKYNRSNLAVKLKDALFIVHPHPKDDAQQRLFDKIVNDTLATPYTWETELSALGTENFECEEAKQEAFARKWCELIASGRLGYMALMRNLRNILGLNVGEDTIMKVARRISNCMEIASAKQFPFRYLSAYKELCGVASLHTPTLLDALENAVAVSASNIKGFDLNTRVMLACDMSGSMRCPISKHSKIMCYEVGNMLAMLLQSRCQQVISGIFADNWKVLNYPHSSILQNTCAISSRIGEVGYGTYGGKPLEWLIKEGVVVDKVMFFTDCQFWGVKNFSDYFVRLWDEYKKINPNAKLYLFDLVGYGHSPIDFPREDVALVAGWSDHIFDVIEAIENGYDAINEINKVDLKIGREKEA